jgi:exonuclease SbcC
MAREQLDTLADANEAAELAAERHHDTLTELAGAVRSALDDLARYEDELRGSRAELATARERLRALTALTPPTALAELADRIRSAAGDVRQLTAALAERTAEETTAEEESAAAGDPAVLERIHAGHAERGRLAAELDHAENRLVEASEAKIGLADLLAQADTEHAEAAANLDQARHLNVAADLASRLTVGEPCPVCLRPVDALPHHPAIVEVTEYEGRVRLRGLQVDRLTTGHRDAEVLCGRLEQTCVDLRSRLGSLDEMLADEPDAAAIEQRLKVIESLRERVDRARADTRAARTAHDGAANRLAALQATAERTWQALDEARDTVAALRPPVPARDDPAAAWQALLAWREETVVAQEEDVEALADAVGWTEAAADELRASIITRLSAVGLDVAGDASPVGIGGTVTAAVATARAELTRIRDNRRRAEDLKVRADRADYEARMARELARLLRANNFERWLVTEALAILIEAAAEILRELSGGQYELSLGEQGEIEVIDYSEAGLRRSARTLSGGETFQAGLALALALAQRVAGFAAAAARSLDAIFLDEGFGTLDAAALDTVAATLERLAASGDRMVGVVTHVPALAERVPVRFEVSRDGSGSRIIRRS